jgi:acetoin utilization deacetylase AcuC-like enzyme
MPGSTAYIFDPRFLDHETEPFAPVLPNGACFEPEPHPSNSRITRRTHELIEGSGALAGCIRLPTRAATVEEIRCYHHPNYIEQVRATAASGGGWLDKETPIAPGSWDAAVLAAGAGMELVDAVVTGHARNAFGLLRPPGHHAMADRGMGFCIFNNVVIATRHAQRRHDIRRVLVLDWDVHHGNGTQAAFRDDPDVVFVSIHQDGWYPANWGPVTDTGGAGAEGRTVNIPLPPGCGDRAYAMAMERVVAPIVRQFRPELIVVSAGQDPGMMDPLGHMMVSMAGFRWMSSLVTALAEEVCEGRMVALQEGGYSAMYTPYCTLAVIEGMTGRITPIEDPYAGDSELDAAQREFRPHQEAAVEEARRVQSTWWRL